MKQLIILMSALFVLSLAKTARAETSLSGVLTVTYGSYEIWSALNPEICQQRLLNYQLAMAEYEANETAHRPIPHMIKPVAPPVPQWGRYENKDEILSAEIDLSAEQESKSQELTIHGIGTVPMELASVRAQILNQEGPSGHQSQVELTFQSLNSEKQVHIEDRDYDCTRRVYGLRPISTTFEALSRVTITPDPSVWAFKILNLTGQGVSVDPRAFKRVHAVVDDLIWLHPGRDFQMEVPIRWSPGQENSLNWNLSIEPYSKF